MKKPAKTIGSKCNFFLFIFYEIVKITSITNCCLLERMECLGIDL